MKTLLTPAFALLLLVSASGTLQAQVPNLLTYQGRVAVGTVNFDGTGQFKFALVNTNGGTTYWRNSPDTTPADGVPDSAVSLAVTKGLYSVLLGDTALANMAAIPASVFTNADVRLRVWFNDGTNGFQLLAPDQRLAAAGYAMTAAGLQLPTTSAGGVDGVIFQNGTRLIHSFGTNNFFAGSAAGNFTMTGGSNTAVGFSALQNNTTGSNNVALGERTLNLNSTGSNNIALGFQAGNNITGSNNISIGSPGVSGQSGVIRIGASGTHTDTFLAGVIRGDGSGLTGITATSLAANSVTSTQLAAGVVTAAKIDTTSVGLWGVTGSNIFRSAGNVGIGTNNPAQTLDVNGVSQSQALELRAAGSTPYLDFSSNLSDDFNARIIWQGTTVNRLDFDAPKFSFLNGNVGIGTSNPAAKLEVFGGARLVNGTTVTLQLSNYDPAFYGVTTPGTQIVATDVGGYTASLDFMTKAFGNQNNALQSRLHINGNTGRVGIGTTSPATTLDVNGEITCVAVNLTSDRNAKEQFKPVNPREVLDKVIGMPITEWQYKTEGDARHIGPMAQDFRAAFALGHDERHITSVDADGVALAAIQGLNEKLREEAARKDEEIKTLRSENRSLAERLAAIERHLKLSGKLDEASR